MKLKKILNKVKWLYKRWSYMHHPFEEFYRIRQFILDVIIFRYFLNFIFRKKSDRLKIKIPYTHHFKNDLEKEKLNLYRILGNHEINLFEIEKWNYDHVNKKEAKNKYFYFFNKQSFSEFGDIKCIADLSRFHFLPFLTIASISNETRQTQVLSLLQSWKIQNPFLHSINWTSGIEVAIRSINLAYCYLALNHHDDIRSIRIKTLLSELIQQHYFFLTTHLSKYSSGNNHFLAELTGIVILASSFEISSEKKLSEYSKIYFGEIKKQFREDGIHFEQSTRYHAEMLDHATNGLLFLSRRGFSIPEDIKNRLTKSFEFICFNTENENLNCTYGDNDEGHLIFPYFEREYNIYSSLKITGELMSGLKSKKDSRNGLIFGDSKPSFTIPRVEFKKEQLYKDSGFYYFKNKAINLSYKFGPLGDYITGAHGHSDIFHFNLSINSTPFLVDSGTYQYHSRYSRERNYFRSAKAHNTIAINNLDQAHQHNRMSWVKMPDVRISKINSSSKETIVKANHNGFIKQGTPICHAREFIFDKEQMIIIIKDELSGGTKKNELSFYLNFHPSTKVLHKNNHILVSNNNNQLQIINPHFHKANIINSSFSNKYDAVGQKKTLLLKLDFDSSLKLETTLLIS